MPLEYLVFSLGFFVIHLVLYVAAGWFTLRFVSGDLYQGEGALLTTFMRDGSDPRQQAGLMGRLLAAQAVRALLMSVVLYPLLGPIGELPFELRALFLGGLMLVYADLASAVPFPNTLEGLVYLQPRFVSRPVFLRISVEAVIYSVAFGILAGWFLF
ncbi:MAG: hypothetical protein AB1Z66_08310 [Candidatus Limnocylindrales bacterium]